jgi:hypothetical protein
MTERRINRLPVVDDTGRLVPGVLDTRTDVAWWRDDSRPSSSESGPEFPPG